MNVSKGFLFIALALTVSVIIGCSHAGNPVSNETNFTSDTGINSVSSTQGIMGIYELIINTDDLTAELHPKRVNTIGESYIVNGISFFTLTPCKNCLELVGLDLTPEGNLAVTFNVQHPFAKGNTGDPPTAKNRLDLDVFDLAMVIAPLEQTPQSFTFAYESIYNDACYNPDGYNLDLFDVIEETAALPYFLVIDESEMDPPPSPTKWNRFEMGSNADFDVVFNLMPGSELKFDMYLTMGYGASAVKADRLTPKYYNPEFNRKAAWKVDVIPPEGDDPPALGNTWNSLDSLTTFDVTVNVYDWQTGAIVSSEPDFADANPSEVYDISEVWEVKVEILGMISDWGTPSSVTGTGMPGDPLVYITAIANESGLPAGEYPALVTVTDNRLIGDPHIDNRDIIIDCPDGINLYYLGIPAYLTYQTFTATVVEG